MAGGQAAWHHGPGLSRSEIGLRDCRKLSQEHNYSRRCTPIYADIIAEPLFTEDFLRLMVFSGFCNALRSLVPEFLLRLDTPQLPEFIRRDAVVAIGIHPPELTLDEGKPAFDFLA